LHDSVRLVLSYIISTQLPMSNKSTIKLLIAFNDPNLEPEERDKQVQVLLTELEQAEIIFAYRIVKCLLGKTFRTILLKKLSV